VDRHEKLSKKYEAILFGYNRTGYSLLRSMRKLKKKLVVVDYNPDTIKHLEDKNFHTIYGDATDIELLEELDFSHMKMVVSTVHDYDANNFLITHVRKQNKDAVIIVVSFQIDEAIALYKEGATYVIMPHFLGGHHASLLIEEHALNPAGFKQIRRQHIRHLHHRKKHGHEHPKHEKK
jgi:Trk K+ transport system NAD-binding subunit